MKRHAHDHTGEEQVLISLIISVGMIALALVGLWLWENLPSVFSDPRSF